MILGLRPRKEQVKRSTFANYYAPMLAAQRQQRILDMVLKSGAVSTTVVAKDLNVSEETARRDFEKLEADGLLFRSHGGAVRLNDSHRDLPLDSRESANVAEKKAVAECALSLIKPGDSLFFDGSSTVFHLARLLPNLDLTVLTTALKVAIELARRPAIRVTLTGGVVGHGSLSCHGDFAAASIERCHVQKAFFSCRGLDLQRGLSEAGVEEADLKRRMIQLAEQTILLADHTKVGVKSSWFFAKLSDLDVFVADCRPSSSVMRALKKERVKLLLPKGKPIE
ncbi:MAG TPA: DeoR/GlpR family DNA-binding transcription regulator [Verrucomicrobiae bacterium]|nr:DeoR/GlpR family DNA-binding transcription regulator [Verrucomicrobiae bacterium]